MFCCYALLLCAVLLSYICSYSLTIRAHVGIRILPLEGSLKLKHNISIETFILREKDQCELNTGGAFIPIRPKVTLMVMSQSP